MRKSTVYWDLLREVSPTMVAAVGITMLLLSGEFDLTIGSMLALTSVVILDTFNRTDSMWLGIAAGLFTGVVIGVLSGTLVTIVGMESLMTTLGIMFSIRGLVYVYTNQSPVVDENQFTQFTRLWYEDIGPVPVPIVIALAIVIVVYFVSTQTEFGRNVYAIGGNANAARVSGINVRQVKFALFVLSGLLASTAGLLYTVSDRYRVLQRRARLRAAKCSPRWYLGGASLAGGQGSVVSTALAVLIIGTIGKGMRVMSIDTTQQLLVVGIVMLVAVYYHRLRKQTAAKMTQEAYAARQLRKGNARV